MYSTRPSFQNRRPMFGRARPVKKVSNHAILTTIARSRQEKLISAVPLEEKPTRSFTDFPLHPQLLANIQFKGYASLTPIQDQAIPAILDGHDVIGTAHTGTGKTAAFLIPLIQKITEKREQRVLVIVPTRELAVQIHAELRSLSRGLSIRTALLIGGNGEWRQIQDLRRDPHVVIATPGRLKDFVQTRVIRLSGFRNVVLDEADRMVDVGFINDIKHFITLLPQARQSLFFSATISEKVGEILVNFVHEPIRVSVKTQDSAAMVQQDVLHIPPHETKLNVLYTLLQKKEFEKVLVFGRTKHGVQRVSDDLSKRGIRSGAIHGNKRQNQRQYILEQFTQNRIQVLLATDVASRGLDIPNVTHVINYDLPETMEDYTHRIGRTGRANRKGVAITFLDSNPNDDRYIPRERV